MIGHFIRLDIFSTVIEIHRNSMTYFLVSISFEETQVEKIETTAAIGLVKVSWNAPLRLTFYECSYCIISDSYEITCSIVLIKKESFIIVHEKLYLTSLILLYNNLSNELLICRLKSILAKLVVIIQFLLVPYYVSRAPRTIHRWNLFVVTWFLETPWTN